jgi:hypothetical protein
VAEAPGFAVELTAARNRVNGNRKSIQ